MLENEKLGGPSLGPRVPVLDNGQKSSGHGRSRRVSKDEFSGDTREYKLLYVAGPVFRGGLSRGRSKGANDDSTHPARAVLQNKYALMVSTPPQTRDMFFHT